MVPDESFPSLHLSAGLGPYGIIEVNFSPFNVDHLADALSGEKQKTDREANRLRYAGLIKAVPQGCNLMPFQYAVPRALACARFHAMTGACGDIVAAFRKAEHRANKCKSTIGLDRRARRYVVQESIHVATANRMHLPGTPCWQHVVFEYALILCPTTLIGLAVFGYIFLAKLANCGAHTQLAALLHLGCARINSQVQLTPRLCESNSRIR